MEKVNLLAVRNNCRKQNKTTDFYLLVSNDNCPFGIFNSPIYSFSLAGNIIVCTPCQGRIRKKYYGNKQQQRLKCRLWWEINTFPSFFFLIGRILSIFRRKKDGLNPSEIDIKVLLSPRRHSLYN